MVLRKPYALLIKNFRIIHFILSILVGYVILKTNSLLYFLNNYIKRGYYDRIASLTDQYANFYFFVVIFVIIVIAVTIYFLMRFKDKPRLFYFSMILIYMAGFIILGRTYFNLQEMQNVVIDPRVIRLTRDMVLIFSFIQYVVIGNTLFTATGFNIKKFGFQEDLEELNISEEDYEEFEFILGFDYEEFKVSLRRRFRNARYVFIENKYVILTAIAIVAIIITTYTVVNTQILNKVYKEGQTFQTNKYDLQILDSYVTSKDYRGNKILSGYNYVVVKFNIKNITNMNYELSTSTVSLVIGNNKYRPNTTMYPLFKDLGKTHVQQMLFPNIRKTLILVYEIESQLATKSMTLEIISSIVGNEVSYKRVKLTPENLDNSTVVKQVKLNDELVFNESILGNTKLKISDAAVKQQFTYNYELCIMKNCNNMSDYVFANTMTRYDKSLLKLDLEFELDGNVTKSVLKDFYDLVETFGTIRYYKNDEPINHIVEINNMTPKYYPGNGIFIDVLKEAETAKKIDILFNIRNKQYVYVIKEG